MGSMGAMGSLLGAVLHGVGHLAGLASDGTPYVPSTPVQIGTSRPRYEVAETGSWQMLVVLLVLVLLVGAAVLLYAVRQRVRVLERRRVRQMAEAAPGEAVAPVPALTPPPSTTHHTRHTGPSSPERVT